MVVVVVVVDVVVDVVNVDAVVNVGVVVNVNVDVVVVVVVVDVAHFFICINEGGGCVHWIAKNHFHLDGLISAKGTSGASYSGGGSGGSILIEAFNMSGHGEANVNGGDGLSGGGGGSGGRIGIHVDFANKYGGTFRAVGGQGNTKARAGGAGTVYKYESQRGPQYREIKYNPEGNFTGFEPEHSKVKVDNEGRETESPAVIMENDTLFYEFDEMQVEGRSHVVFYHPRGALNVTVVAHEVTGDKTGVIKMTSRQRLFVFVVESTHTYLDVPCGFYIDDYAEVVFPTEVILRGETTTLRGRMTGVEWLVIERNGNILISGTAHTARLPEQARWYDDRPFDPFTPGLLVIPELIVNNRGILTVAMTPYRGEIIASDITMKKGKS